MRPLGVVLAGAGAIDIDAAVLSSPCRNGVPPYGPTEECGRYLTSITCVHCHGADLRGGEPFGLDEPTGSDLAPQVRGRWTCLWPPCAAVWPAVEMPSKYLRHMTGDELAAVHVYLGRS